MISYTFTTYPFFLAGVCTITVFQVLLFPAFHNLWYLLVSRIKMAFYRVKQFAEKSAKVQLYYVLIVQDVVSLGVLAVVNARAPNPGKFKFFSELSVNG